MPGKVVKINKQTGDHVEVGETVLVVESMKMENNMLSEINGVVREINVEEGDMIDSSVILASISKNNE